MSGRVMSHRPTSMSRLGRSRRSQSHATASSGKTPSWTPGTCFLGIKVFDRLLERVEGRHPDTIYGS